MTEIKSKKLNLGCDFDYKEGWTNLDQYSSRADVVHNLDKYPWPFKNNTFDYVLASHVLEHLENLPRALNELWRISKSGAIIEIKVPYFNNFNAFRDATHKRFFTWDTLTPFTGRVSSKEKENVGYFHKLFDYSSRKLVWGSTRNPILNIICKIMNSLVNISPEFMERRIPFWITVEAIHIKLRVKK